MQITYFILKERSHPRFVSLRNPSDKNKPGSSVFSEHVCFGICSSRHSFIAAVAFGAELKKENKTTWWKYDIWFKTFPRFPPKKPTREKLQQRGGVSQECVNVIFSIMLTHGRMML